ncbi:methyltransferase [Pseudodesulfovibrio cashew]|uniref:Methyltransferase n=1 Tax=Pseudodesulfovibrio cashew TaxID=2678688 RepID=A0A6I6JEV7_9BACT|nr:methyltransferase [Pseudodesulfovibrio cashew]QGY39620.1 methyltransferase [Pseudodesulfovibrio cashew]
MTGVDTKAVLERREFFPRGMIQPEGGYRFSLDSLLLACFARPGRRHVGVDLGCGCGVVGLALLLREPGVTVTGVEIDTQSIEAAAANADSLLLSGKFSVMQGDVGSWRPEKVVDFVVANPPYRELGRGRVSRGDSRATARFEDRGSFAGFARCAAVALKTRGKFSFVHIPERLPALMAALHANGLEPKRMRLVHGRVDEPARMVLMETVKAGGSGLKVEAPLILHEGRGKETRLTREVIEFCPFLDCNPGTEETA